MKVDDLKDWAIFGLFFLSSIEILVINSLLYVNWGGGEIDGILKFNFYMFLIIGFGLLFLIGVIFTIKYIIHSFKKMDMEKSEWNDEW